MKVNTPTSGQYPWWRWARTWRWSFPQCWCWGHGEYAESWAAPPATWWCWPSIWNKHPFYNSSIAELAERAHCWSRAFLKGTMFRRQIIHSPQSESWRWGWSPWGRKQVKLKKQGPWILKKIYYLLFSWNYHHYYEWGHWKEKKFI